MDHPCFHPHFKSGFSALTLPPSVPVLLLVKISLALPRGLLNTLLRNLLAKSVRADEVGGDLGHSASQERLTHVNAPGLGGFSLGSIGTWTPGLMEAGIMIGVILISRFRIGRERG
jgi:hypothetical protein